MSGGFSIGDVVVRKSGGPMMMVIRVLNGPLTFYQCSWFDGDDVQSKVFLADSLVEPCFADMVFAGI